MSGADKPTFSDECTLVVFRDGKPVNRVSTITNDSFRRSVLQAILEAAEEVLTEFLHRSDKTVSSGESNESKESEESI